VFKSDVTTRDRDRSRDVRRSKTHDDYDDKKSKSKKDNGDGKKEKNPYRHKGYEDYKQTNKDLGEEVLDEVFNEGWI
jgi:hypothetical protein